MIQKKIPHNMYTLDTKIDARAVKTEQNTLSGVMYLSTSVHIRDKVTNKFDHMYIPIEIDRVRKNIKFGFENLFLYGNKIELDSSKLTDIKLAPRFQEESVYGGASDNSDLGRYIISHNNFQISENQAKLLTTITKYILANVSAGSDLGSWKRVSVSPEFNNPANLIGMFTGFPSILAQYAFTAKSFYQPVKRGKPDFELDSAEMLEMRSSIYNFFKVFNNVPENCIDYIQSKKQVRRNTVTNPKRKSKPIKLRPIESGKISLMQLGSDEIEPKGARQKRKKRVYIEDG